VTPPALCHCSGLCAHLGACLPACVTVCPLMLRADSAFLRLYLSIGFFESVSSLSVNKHEQACPPLPPPPVMRRLLMYLRRSWSVSPPSSSTAPPPSCPQTLKLPWSTCCLASRWKATCAPAACTSRVRAWVGSGVRGWDGGTVALAILLSKPLRPALPSPSVCALVWSGACMHLPACQPVSHA
jgi:hypothetical protein